MTARTRLRTAATLLLLATFLSGCAIPRPAVVDSAEPAAPALRRSENLGTDAPAATRKPAKIIATARQTSPSPTATTPAARPMIATAAPTPPPASVEAPAANVSSVFFAEDSDRVEGPARRKLQEAAERLKSRRRSDVTLIGHAEDKGSTELSIALAQKRVDAVAEVLEGFGVWPRQIRRVSYGNEAAPATDCRNEPCRQRMRRVDLRFSSEG